MANHSLSEASALGGIGGDVAMRSVLFLVGLVLGFLGGVGTIIYLQQRNKDTGEMSIVFAQKSYYETPAVVTVSGTLTGEGLGYPNNTYSIAKIAKNAG